MRHRRRRSPIKRRRLTPAERKRIQKMLAKSRRRREQWLKRLREYKRRIQRRHRKNLERISEQRYIARQLRRATWYRKLREQEKMRKRRLKFRAENELLRWRRNLEKFKKMIEDRHRRFQLRNRLMLKKLEEESRRNKEAFQRELQRMRERANRLASFNILKKSPSKTPARKRTKTVYVFKGNKSASKKVSVAKVKK